MSEHDTPSTVSDSPDAPARLLPALALGDDVREVLVEIGLHAGDNLSFDLTGTPFVLANGQLFKNGVETGLTVGLGFHEDSSAHLHVTGAGAADSYAALLQALQLTSNDARDAARAVVLTTTDFDGASQIVSLTGTAALLPHALSDAESWTVAENKNADVAPSVSAPAGTLDLSDLLAGGTYQPGLSPVDHFIRVDYLTGDVFVDKSGGGHFGVAAVATVPAGSALDTLNVILHDHEGTRVVHSS